MWQYNFTYLCHADQRKDHKYIDRYKDRRGNWQYVYAEDQASRAQNARRFQEQNSTYNRVDRILNKNTNSKAGSYKNIGNYRKSLELNKDFSNTNEAQNAREAAIAKGTATAQRNKREYSAQNYRTAMTNSRTAGAKNASEAGESDRYAREKRQNAIPSYLRNYTKGSAERQGARAKDLDDVEKRNKTSEYLKAATERNKKESATSRTVAAQNAREAAIAKGAETAQKSKTKSILNNATARYEASTSRTDAAQNAREAAIQKSANQTQWDNRAKEARDSADKRQTEIWKAARDQQVKAYRSMLNLDENKELRKALKKKDTKAVDKIIDQAERLAYDIGDHHNFSHFVELLENDKRWKESGVRRIGPIDRDNIERRQKFYDRHMGEIDTERTYDKVKDIYDKVKKGEDNVPSQGWLNSVALSLQKESFMGEELRPAGNIEKQRINQIKNMLNELARMRATGK